MPTLRNSGVSKKTSKACNRCRALKVKCSGTQPCERCARSSKHQCVFAIEEKRVAVPESYLRELERRSTIVNTKNVPIPGADGLQSQTESLSPTHGPTDSPGRRNVGETASNNPQDSAVTEPGFRQNPLVDYDLTFPKAAGRYWYMGPSSSWSFCRRVFALIRQRIHEADCPPVPWNFDGTAFHMDWASLPRDKCPDVSNLPPLDYALFLYNTAKFYLGGNLMCLIDEGNFLRQLNELYADPQLKARQCRYWYATYLLIIAFGKAFACTRGHHGPSGYQYAQRAMELLPSISILPADTIEGIQLLALAAIYLQSLDMRVGAFQVIGQALRLCLVEGMHREMREEVEREHSQRCSAVFWTVYVLEREFSALFGAPSSIRDEDITAKLPAEAENAADPSMLKLHVQLSRLRAQIMDTVYSVEPAAADSLVSNVQKILRNLATMLEDMRVDSHLHGPNSLASRKALRLILGHHHCVVLSTRPLVMCALNLCLDRRQRQITEAISLSPAVTSLLQACLDSAQTTLRTLRLLAEEELLEGFLPFQVEDAFSSAFILQLISFVAPDLVLDEVWHVNAQIAFDHMVARGSILAPLRLEELRQLERTLSSLKPGARSEDTMEHGHEVETQLGDDGHGLHEPGWNLFFMDCLGTLSSQDMMGLADQLDSEIEFAALM